MNFLVDAQLPHRLVLHLRLAGHNALHTFDLPHGNRTLDGEINDISVRNQRIVVTKDADFVDSFLLVRRPYKLLLVSTGNIKNAELDALFVPQIPAIVAVFRDHSFVELTRTGLIVHE